MIRMFAALVADFFTALVAVSAGMPAAKDGRQLNAEFGSASCGPASGLPIKLSEDDQAVTSLRPGIYWITLNDSCSSHNFVLNDAQVSNGDGDVLTGPVPSTPGIVYLKLQLNHGTYRLYCGNLSHTPHVRGLHCRRGGPDRLAASTRR